MHAPRCRIDFFLQRIRISRFEFGKAAPIKDFLDDFMLRFMEMAPEARDEFMDLVTQANLLEEALAKAIAGRQTAEAAKYTDSDAVYKLLLSGVIDIIDSPAAMKQARIYAKSSGISVEQVLVDNATALAKQKGYIASK